jgi:hypothetical protein
MSTSRYRWYTATGEVGTRREPSRAPEPPSLEQVAAVDRTFLSQPARPGSSADEDAGELLAQVQDLWRIAAHLASKADAGESQRPPKEKLAASNGRALLSLVRETLLEKVYPLAHHLQGTHWHGPRLPHDLLPRFTHKRAPDSEPDHVPEDLYTAAEIGSWLAGSGTPALDGLHTYRHNLYRHLSEDSSDLRTRVCAMANVLPLGFVAREHGWQRTLEFLDGLWAHAWFLEHMVVLLLRAALVRCVASHLPRPASVAEALDVLRRALDRKYMPEGHEIPSLLVTVAAMQEQLNTELKHLRHDSRSMTEWLRGLHALLLPATHVAHLLHGMARQADPSLAPDLRRQYRFHEELRADMAGCLEDPCMYVPHAMAEQVLAQRTRRDAKRALLFYCHSRVFIPLVLLPLLEEVIDSLPDWPLPADSRELHTRFAAKLKACIGGGFVRAYESIYPEAREAQALESERKWNQLTASPEYQALPYVGQLVTHSLYMTWWMRSRQQETGNPYTGVTLTPTEKDSHHPKVQFRVDEQGHIHSAHALIRSESSEARADYDTSGAAEALIALLKGIHLAVRNAYPAERLELVLIDWPGRPVRMVIELEQLKVTGFAPVELAAPPGAERAKGSCGPGELARVTKAFGQALAAAGDASLFSPVVRVGIPPAPR